MKKLIAAACALALVATPVFAASRPAAAVPAPASETVSGEQLQGGIFSVQWIALLAIIAVLVANLTDGDGDGPGEPTSP